MISWEIYGQQCELAETHSKINQIRTCHARIFLLQYLLEHWIVLQQTTVQSQSCLLSLRTSKHHQQLAIWF